MWRRSGGFYEILACIRWFPVGKQRQSHTFQRPGESGVAGQYFCVQVSGLLGLSLLKTDFSHEAKNIGISAKFRQCAAANQLGFFNIARIERFQGFFITLFYGICRHRNCQNTV